MNVQMIHPGCTKLTEMYGKNVKNVPARAKISMGFEFVRLPMRDTRPAKTGSISSSSTDRTSSSSPS